MGTQAGVGISHHRNPKIAGLEAAVGALKQAGVHEPDFVFMFASVGYNQQLLLDAVRQATNYAPLCGCSGEGVITPGEVDESNFSVAVMVIKSDELRFDYGYTVGLKANPTQIGGNIGQAVRRVWQPDAVAMFLLADGLTLNFDRLLQGLETELALERSVPLFGGASADNWEFLQTYQYCDDQVISDGAVWTLLSGRANLAWAVNHGCIPIGGRRKVTRCAGNVIYEIDHQPVLSVLQEYLIGGEIDNWQAAVINLCLGFKAPGFMKDYGEYLIRFIPGRDDEAASITIQTEVTEGTDIWITRRDHLKIIEGVNQMADSIVAQLNGAHPKLVFQFDCCGRGKVVLREDQKIELQTFLQQRVGASAPWIGFYTSGEIGPVGDRNCFHNYTAVLAAIY